LIFYVAIDNPQSFALLFFGVQRKVTKEIRPALRKAPLSAQVSMAWAKTRWLKWHASSSCADNFLNNRRVIGIYSLKQFAHVIHGNPNAQGRTAMGSPSPTGIGSSG